MTKDKKRPYKGRTVAYSKFIENLWNTEQLINLGILGIDKKIEDMNPLIEKFKSIKGVPGPKPKDHKPSIRAKRKSKGNEIIELELDPRSAYAMKKSLEFTYQKHDGLRFFLYMSMAANVWAAFETYHQMLYSELFNKLPMMLKSGETITKNEVIQNRESIVEYLIDCQVESIGHMSLKELISYNKAKLNISYDQKHEKVLKDYYFIRNVISHNSGIVRESQIRQVPKGIKIIDGRIHVSKSFLQEMIKNIRATIVRFEKDIESKFFNNR